MAHPEIHPLHILHGGGQEWRERRGHHAAAGPAPCPALSTCLTTQHKTTHHSPTQHNTTHHSPTQHNTTQHDTRTHLLTPTFGPLPSIHNISRSPRCVLLFGEDPLCHTRLLTLARRLFVTLTLPPPATTLRSLPPLCRRTRRHIAPAFGSVCLTWTWPTSPARPTDESCNAVDAPGSTSEHHPQPGLLFYRPGHPLGGATYL